MNRILCKPIRRGGRRFVGSSWILSASLLAVLFASGCLPFDYEINISHYDPSQAWSGDTFFQTHLFFPALFAIDMEGQAHWVRSQEFVIYGTGVGLTVMENGNALTLYEASTPTIIDPETNENVWTDAEHVGHHTVAETPWGTVMSLGTYTVDHGYPPWWFCTVLGDYIFEVEYPSGDVLWEWYLGDHVDPVEHHWDGMCTQAPGDWSHCNTVKVIQNYRYDGRTYDNVILILSRNLDTFWLIDYPSGDIIWGCGQHGDFGRREPPQEPFFVAGHEIDMLNNGHFLLFDNGDGRAVSLSRALELAVDPKAGTVEEVWSWTDDQDPPMFSMWGGDADRLPNGNTLVSNVQKGRVVEVNPAGEKVWQMDIRHPDVLPGAASFTTFMAKRVPSREW